MKEKDCLGAAGRAAAHREVNKLFIFCFIFKIVVCSPKVRLLRSVERGWVCLVGQ